MSFFESLVALLLTAIVLLQFSRRMRIPYPTMLAAAGVVLALIPGTPSITLDPATALALFIAPALVDAAFDFPAGAVRKLWRQLFAMAVVAVLLTTAAVMWLGVAMAGLPFYAALALGAIVSPPDAVAATAMLGNMHMPRRSVAVLKGEGLLNDATALLLFSAAVTVQAAGGIDGGVALRLALAAPGGILFGIVFALLFRRVSRFVGSTLGGNLLEFATTFAVWFLAERMHLSPVLCLVAFAMTVARSAGLQQRARVRVHSFAVWTSVVFLLNVVAFMLMGMQVRTIVGGMSADRLQQVLSFAAAAVVVVIGVRMIWVLGYNWLSRHFASLRGPVQVPSFAQGVLVGWCGMRGLITMATAFALPAGFSQRDLIVLTAFAVVLATLVIQGLTLAPLVRLLDLDKTKELERELEDARVQLAQTALATLEGKEGPEADHLRYGFLLERNAAQSTQSTPLDKRRRLGLAAIRSQRKRLEQLRSGSIVGADSYLALQEELDFRELAITSEDERHIEEN